MEELVAKQSYIGSEIQKIVNKYKKQQAEKRTEGFLQECLGSLDNLWSTFESTDNQIRIQFPEQLGNNYFTSEYYHSIQKVRDFYYEEINKELEILRSEENPTTGALQQTASSNKDEQTTTEGLTKSDDKATQLNPPQLKVRSTSPQGRGNKSNAPSTNRLNSLIRKQNTAMTSLQRLIAGISLEEAEISSGYRNHKIKSINDHWSRIKVLNDQLLEASDSATGEEFFTLEDSVQDTIIKLLQRGDQPISNSTIDDTVTKPQMKLPKITIPQFDGDYLKWQQFHDLFLQMIHQQPISKAQKMWFLKTNISGEAERLIRHLQISDDNYDSAWEILTQRFNNKRLLAAALLDKLLGQQAVQIESSFTIKRLHDTTKECLMALNNMNIPTDTWDPILLHLLIKKLDKTTHNLYEQGLKAPRELQSLNKFLEFLEQRFQSLEALGKYKGESKSSTTKVATLTTSTKKAKTMSCSLCKGNHGIFACSKFLQCSPSERLKTVNKLQLCTNCLKSKHSLVQCPSRGCLKCQQKHNTLLHKDNTTQHINKSNNEVTSITSTSGQDKGLKNASVYLAERFRQTSRNYILLGTVLLNLSTSKTNGLECRAILDSGSQLNFITQKLADQLGLKQINETINIYGIGGSKKQSSHRINVKLTSQKTSFSSRIEAFVLPEITCSQPEHELQISDWRIPKNIELADPSFHQPGPVDLLIGAELYYQLLVVGQIKLGDNLPTLQNTVFGWIVAGKTQEPMHKVTCNISTAEKSRLEKQVEKFWTMEEDQVSVQRQTAEQKKCETIFAQTTKRDNTGRFIVRLPFINNPAELGESKDIAYNRFLSLERKLNRNPDLRQQYTEFMDQYIQLEHMSECDLKEITKPYYFLPHHCVLKPDSTTTKLRVVFDASARTSSNVSLNDILATGPTIQQDLFAILLRFRLPLFVFTADIEKMYRQILVHSDDRKFQLIWWRNDPKQQLKCYNLNTVTYGTTSAPYLATKCLQQLATIEATKYPQASVIAKRDFYVDDLMTGTNNLSETVEVQKQIISLLQAGGFNLRKWCANHPKLLENIPAEDKALELNITDDSETIKTLGLSWQPAADEFHIKITNIERNAITKRTVLSDIARLFDPLGFLSPVVIKAKIFLQLLWHMKLDWDKALPMDLHTSWLNFRENLQALNSVKIPRQVLGGNPSSIEVHIFADASQRALGAAVYIRAVHVGGKVTIRLLCAKSKVAPLKTTTLPRLELCAAKIAAELADRVKTDLQLNNIQFHYWSDSEVTLDWINSEPVDYPTFVANRISAIQHLTLAEQWRHVDSKCNPADLLSRGVSPERFADHANWLCGPLFLYGPRTSWPPPYVKGNTDQEKKPLRVTLTTTEGPSNVIHLIDHRNSLVCWQRVVAYVLRFIKNSRSNKAERESQNLTVQELDNALTVMIKVVQAETFQEDIKQLKQGGAVAANSSLSSLTPFLDNKSIIRVGGRLEASNLSYNTKHPILLPYGHVFTRLLMTELHIKHLHAGPQTLLAITRQRYWPIKGKTIARSIVGNCVSCARAKPKLFNQIMGNLPATRTTPSRPFINTGVDFFGPLLVHYKGRGSRPQKAYVAVFCCFSTKAVHFEVVSDLSTQTFIGALKRFVGRRGNCENIYCDNATNFVGAKNQLAEINQMLHTEDAKKDITTMCSMKGIEFHFIPPRAPHFGGLWEAAVKSAKHYLHRQLGNANLTYEELETLMIEIEAILNSRPLTPLSSDPNDFNALTPGHFLIGEPLTTIRDPTTDHTSPSSLNRWKQIMYLKNSFWQRWSSEYLSELQQRHKWKGKHNNIENGTMVIIKNDNIPPASWQLGRIINTIPGEDGLVRVADVKTAKGVLRRPIHKLAPLPIVDIEQETSPTQQQQSVKHKMSEENQPSTSGYKPTPSSSQDQAAPTKRARSGLSIFSMLLVIGLILPAFGKVTINRFESDPGLYFDRMGAAHLIANEWNIVVFYNLSAYWQEHKALANGITNLGNICAHMVEKSGCNQTIAQFHNTVHELNAGDKLLSHQTRSPLRTKRRAPLNIVGNIFNAVFGVLDSDYAEQMTKTIENLQNNDEHLLQLIKNQTSIIDSTLNIMKASQQQMTERFRELEGYVNMTTKRLNDLKGELFQQQLGQIFSSVSIQLILMFNNHIRIQSTLLDVLMDSRHGRINSQLLSPDQLQAELQLIQQNIPPSLKLPSKFDNLLELYNMMSVEGRTLQNQMIFRIKLPLFSREQFEILHIIPVPFKHNGTYMRLRPSFDYMITNLQRDQYYPLSAIEVSSCSTFKEEFSCKQHHPLYGRNLNFSDCEISLLIHSEPRTPCDIERSTTQIPWTKLTTPNTWIYSMKNKTNINVVCGESITQQELSGAGILHLDPNCALNDDHITIRGQITYSSRMHTGYTTATNLTNLLKSSILAKSTSEEIQDVKSQLNSLKNNEHLPDALNNHHIHHYALNYSCIFLIVAIIGGIIWTYTRLIKAKGESIQLQLPASIPIPSPRTTNQPALNLEVDEGLLTEAQRGEDVKFHHK